MRHLTSPNLLHIRNFAMPRLNYGLNVAKKPSSIAGERPLKRKRIFEDEDDVDEARGQNTTEEIETFDGLSTIPELSPNKPTNKRSSDVIPKKPDALQYDHLSSAYTATKQSKTVQAIDSSVYDYDAVYDSLHARPSTSIAPSAVKGPIYMGNLLAAAEIRKRDQLRAKEKMLLREREAEGDEFADKEKFVTGAYKAQQEEVKRMEEEEAKREAAEEERRRKGGGMVGLYKGLLDQTEERHAEIMKSIEENKGKETQPGEAVAEPDADSVEAELARAKGAVLNEDGQIVDKRQLLRAGLNIVPKPKAGPFSTVTSASEAPSRAATDLPTGLSSRAGAKQAQRERQTKLLEQQLEKQARKAQEDQDAKRKALEAGTRSRKTEKDITGARERYLARKREEAEKLTR